MAMTACTAADVVANVISIFGVVAIIVLAVVLARATSRPGP
jgi:hypothetical protein